MIGILLHRTSGDRQLVHAARTDCGSCLTPQDNLLRELLVIRPVLVRTVIESGYIHYGSHIIIHHCVRSIHALSDGAGGSLRGDEMSCRKRDTSVRGHRSTGREPRCRCTTSRHWDCCGTGESGSPSLFPPIRQISYDNRSAIWLLSIRRTIRT